MKKFQAHYLLRPLIALLIIFTGYVARSQVQTSQFTSISSNTHAFYEYLPQGYSYSSQNYPLIIFVHGIGECGDGSPSQLPKVLVNGPPKLINNGVFPTSFSSNGITTSFIVISPQFAGWPQPSDIDAVINYAVSHYRVDQSRIYLTGLSMGGGSVWSYASASAGNAQRIAAIVPVCGAAYPVVEEARIIASANLPVWALQNMFDPTVSPSYTQNWTSYINQSPTPYPAARQTLFNSGGHDAWSMAYDPNYRENNMNVYQWMLQFSRSGTPKVNPPPPPPAPWPTPGPSSFTLLPAKIEAENWSAFNSVQTEPTSDIGGGLDVGYISPGSWMDYAVNVPSSGNYTVQFRVAAPASNAQFQLRKADGSALATINVPNTGGYQNWQTVNAAVFLSQGQQTLRIFSTGSQGNNWNINWLNCIASASAPPPPTTGSSIKVEAENWSAFNSVQTESTSDIGGGLDVGYINPGSWMDYTINMPSAGSYTVQFRLASPANNAQFQLRKADGSALATINVPNTGGYQSWQTVNATVSLSQGQQTLRIFSTGPQGNNWNINWFNCIPGATAQPTTGSSFKIEAENWSAFNSVQTESTSDIGGGLDVDYINPGSWMDYSVNAPSSGNYTIQFRVASPASNAQFQLRKADGSALATIKVPNTGGYQSWQTVNATVFLSQGQQTLRIFSTAPQWNNWNINWFNFIPGGTLSSIAAKASDGSSFSISPIAVVDKFILSIDNAFSGSMMVQIVDGAGVVKKDFALIKSVTGPTQTYLSIGDLAAGTYTIQVVMNNWKANQQLVKQ